MPVDLSCRLGHAAFRVVEDQIAAEDRLLANLGHTLHIALIVPGFAAVWHAVAETDLVGMIPRRLAERVAGPARLDIYAMPFAMPREELCQAWHRRNSTARGLAWFRAQVVDILAKLDDGPDPAQDGVSGHTTPSSPEMD